MIFPHITAEYTAGFAILFGVLSLWVMLARIKSGTLHGDGGDQYITRRMRAHANFAEYLPIILLMMALLEGRGASNTVLHALLAPLLVARVAHPLGMLTGENSPAQFVLRGGGIVVTLLVLFATAALLLLRG